MKKNILAVTVFWLASLAPMQAQHEISIYGAGGPSALQYKSNQGTVETGIGGLGGLGYSYSFSPKLGVNTGVELALFSASVKANELAGSSQEVYNYGGRTEDLFFNGTYRNYEEKQSAMYLQIPLMLQFRSAENNAFYAAAGVKAGIAVSSSFKITAGELTTSAYLPETAQKFVDMPEYGYTTTNSVSSSPKSDLGFNLSLAAEAGYRLKLSDKLSLYGGLYIDYGVLNVLPSQKESDLVYRQNGDLTNFSYNSLLTATNPDGKSYVDKLNLFAVGVKIKIAYSLK
jgi:hypothetical protein